MKIPLRSNKSTVGRLMAGARSLWRANGMQSAQFGKPIIGIANSFTQLVPGHMHLHKVGQRIKERIGALGCFAAEFNTIAIDDGIAMGHEGMLYSLPSRELIADSVESMANAHCIDALICVSNCDKITPGMMMAAMRLNIPTIFVSGGPMEAGNFEGKNIDLVTAMGAAVASSDVMSSEKLHAIELSACPTCGSCSGMFTANSMNCLMEALGLGLPGNGTILATHVDRLTLVDQAADTIVQMAMRHYGEGCQKVLPRSIVTYNALCNAMALDVAMGGSTNTVLHILAIAQEGGINFTMKDIDEISRHTPVLCKVAPSSSYHIQDVNRAGGVMNILAELSRGNNIDQRVGHVAMYTGNGWLDFGDVIDAYDILSKDGRNFKKIYFGAPGNKSQSEMGKVFAQYEYLDRDRISGCIRGIDHAYSKDGGLAVLHGNLATDGCVVKTAGVDDSMLVHKGTAMVFDSQEDAVEAIITNKIKPNTAIVIRWEGPKGGPGMQEMLYPTTYLKAKGLDKQGCFLVTDGRFSGGTCGPCIGHISPEAASGGRIGLVENGDLISYNIPRRWIVAQFMGRPLEERVRRKNDSPNRSREVSNYLRRYAHFATSASKGAVQNIP